ncbi:RodZ domain-containing protein [Vibrio sp. RC27]
MNNELLDMQPEVIKPHIHVVEKPGTLLLQKRESQNLTRKHVAEKLRLREAVIQSLDDSDFDSIGKEKTFIRGYLRSYARVVGADENVILAAYDSYCGEVPQEVDMKMKSFSERTKHEANNNRLNYITFGVIFVVIGISSIWWYQNQSNDSLLSDTNATQTAQVELPVVEEVDNVVKTTNTEVLNPAVESQAVTVEQTEGSFEGPVRDESSNPPESVISEQATESLSTEASNDAVLKELTEASDSRIVMTFSADCWIQIIDATGKTLTVGTKKPNQVVSLDGQAPFKVILGAPETVSMTYSSEPVDLSRYTSGKVARFTLP